MLKLASNISLSHQIANVYCNKDEICKAGVIERLNYLNDVQFNKFVSTLSSRAYLTGNFINLGYNQFNQVKIKFVYTDLIKGVTGSSERLVSRGYFEPTFKPQALLDFLEPGLIYVTTLPDGTIIFAQTAYGYEISLTQPAGSTSGSTSGNYTTGGGTIQVNSKVVNPQTAPANEPVITAGFNWNSLLIPGIAVAAFVLLKDKF